MRIFKEYPATHSMMTSWFAIDEDGNVAIMQYEDNGPVPIGTPESSEEEILEIMSHSEIDKPWKSLPLTKDEVQFLLDNSYPINEVENDDYIDSSIVRVQHSRLSEFYETAKIVGDTTICIDPDNGLFYLDWFGHTPTLSKAITKALESGLIKPLKRIFMDIDEGETDMNGLPFIIYQQSYNTGKQMTRRQVPPFTFNEKRLSEEAKIKAHRLPLKFKDNEELQIAKYITYSAYGTKEKLINHRHYQLLETAEGEETYLAIESIYYAGCGKKCKICWNKGDRHNITYPLQKDRHPTVMVIKGIDEIPYEIMTSFEKPFSKAVFIPLIEGIPDKEWKAISQKSLNDYPISYMFQFCRVNLEENVRFFNPRVILIYKEIIPYITEFYPMRNGMLEIIGKKYPAFIFEDYKSHIDTITELADMSYRGEDIEWLVPLNKETL